MTDPNSMELVSMVVSSLPVGPLPIIAGQEIADEITFVSGEHKVANSHDLMGMLLLTAFQQNDPAKNQERCENQKRIMNAFFDEIDQINPMVISKTLFLFISHFFF